MNPDDIKKILDDYIKSYDYDDYYGAYKYDPWIVEKQAEVRKDIHSLYTDYDPDPYHYNPGKIPEVFRPDPPSEKYVTDTAVQWVGALVTLAAGDIESGLGTVIAILVNHKDQLVGRVMWSSSDMPTMSTEKITDMEIIQPPPGA